jgi:hypothetical protein
MHLDIASIFGGEALEILTTITDESGEAILNGGVGFWHVAPDGTVRCAAFGEAVGFAILTEQPDDPGTLAMSGPLSDDRVMHTVVALDDQELIMSTAVVEGYDGTPRGRTVGRLRKRRALQAELR